jgi:hypothetical protein
MENYSNSEKVLTVAFLVLSIAMVAAAAARIIQIVF